MKTADELARELIHQLQGDAVSSFFSESDKLILAAIKKKGFDLTIEQLKERGRIIDHAGTKTIFIDETPICYFTEPEYRMEENTIKCEFKFREWV